MSESLAELSTAVARLVNQVGHWTPARWSVSDAASKAHALAQQLADLAADASGEPRHTVPRLDNDLALTDQIRVTANDLMASRPTEAALAAALASIKAFRQAI